MWHDQTAMNEAGGTTLSGKALQIAHISDLHLPFTPRLTLRQRFSKRQLSVWSWQRRRAIQRPEILAALAADLRQARPDQVVITGDITNFSLPAEFQGAARWLAELGTDIPINLVPGNHDALVPVDNAQGIGLWSRWCRDASWPYLQRRGQVSLIGLCSAVPTLPLLAGGSLGQPQLEKLEQFLAAEGEAGQIRVLLLHHPVVDGAVAWRKALRDRRLLRAVIGRVGAELILHGHARHARLDALPSPVGNVPVLCVPSSTALPNPRDEAARWHRLTFHSQQDSHWVQVEVRQWSVELSAFAPVAEYRLALPPVK
jgi:3',5'-cyclic AMP phosphodiesterase CpdA